MYLLYLRLENFIGIYNGLGLDCIEIDFSRCKHHKIVIKGDNGTGKSTLNKALTPLPDNSIEIIPNKLGKKVLRYLLNDSSILYIEYQYQISSTNTRKGSKCIIKREINGESIDLNPSFNMNSGKDIIYEFFNLDDNYITLTQLSANNKGLGSLKPSERKKYVNNIISSLQEYNDMYKLFTKKSIGLKSLMNSITAKLEQIGNIDILQNVIINNQSQLEVLEKEKDVLMGEKAIITNKIQEITKDGDVISIFKELEEKRKQLQEDISNIKTVDEYSDELLIMTEKELTRLEVEEDNSRKELEALNTTIEDMSSKIFEQEEKLKLFSDKDTIISIFNSYNTQKIAIENQLKTYVESFNRIGFEDCKDITEEEYSNCLDLINSFNEFIDSILDTYDDRELVTEAYEVMSKKRELKDKEYRNKIDAHKETLHNLEITLTKVEDAKKLIEEHGQNIPEDCTHKHDMGCPFLNLLIPAYQVVRSYNYEELVNNINKEENIIKELSKLYERELLIKECSNQIQAMVTYIKLYRKLLKKFPNTEPLMNDSDLKWNITNFLKVNIDISIYREYTNHISLINHAKEDIESIESKLEEIKDDIHKRMDILKELTHIKDIEINNIKEKRDIESSLADLNEKKNNTKTYLERLYFIKANKDKLDDMNTDLNNTNKRLEELLRQKDEYMELSIKSNEINKRLLTITNKEIPSIKGALDKAKYSMSLYDHYKQDYEKYETTYNQVQMFRQYSSMNGIQTIYMEAYMNSILKTANDLLKHLFNGRFLLQPFIINETEFRIPCIDNEGRLRQDISFMSDSQLSMISMIISFSLLHKASGSYNIIKLDEVDSNLDNSNRLQFSVLISHIMSLLNFSQCIIISHNNELDLSNTDMIIFRVENKENYSSLLATGCNVIFDVNM